MNEYERRSIEVVQNHMQLSAAAKQMNTAAIVEYFGYSLQIGAVGNPLLNGVTQQGIIAIQADAHFVLEYVSSCVVVPLNPEYVFNPANILLQITDTGAGEVLYSEAVSASLATSGTTANGFNGIPFLLPVPRVIPPNTNIKIEATQFGVHAGDNPEPLAFFVSLLGARVAQI